jgi:hypothetical protein
MSKNTIAVNNLPICPKCKSVDCSVVRTFMRIQRMPDHVQNIQVMDCQCNQCKNEFTVQNYLG